MKLFNEFGQFSIPAVVGFVAIFSTVVGGVAWHFASIVKAEERSLCESIGAVRYPLYRSTAICRMPDGTLKAMPAS